MKYLLYQQRKVAYNVQGKGANALVFLHGFCEDSTIWDEWKDELVAAGYKVVCADLPGFGESELAQEASIEYYADTVQAVVQEAIGQNRFLLIGHSMGGYTALAFAEKYPEQLAGLGLFHSHPYADSEAKKEARQKSIRFVQEQGTALYVKQLISDLFAAAWARTNSFVVNRLIHKASTYAPQGIIDGLTAMMARPDRHGVLECANWPVLFIIGEEDKAIPAELSLAQTSLPATASVHILEKIGHMGMLEAPRKTRQIVREFAEYCFNGIVRSD